MEKYVFIYSVWWWFIYSFCCTSENDTILQINYTSIKNKVELVVIQLLSPVQLFVTSWTAAHQASLSFTISQSLLKLMSIGSVMPASYLILCHPFLLLSSIFRSIRIFSNVLTLCIKWPKYYSFSFSISPFNDYSGLISFSIDWFDLLVAQGTLKSFL